MKASRSLGLFTLAVFLFGAQGRGVGGCTPESQVLLVFLDRLPLLAVLACGCDRPKCTERTKHNSCVHMCWRGYALQGCLRDGASIAYRLVQNKRAPIVAYMGA